MISRSAPLLMVDDDSYVIVYDLDGSERLRFRPHEGGLVATPEGLIERLGAPEQVFRCVSGLVDLPYELCAERFEAHDLMRRALEGDPYLGKP